jgi:hypothetical protein
VAARVAELKPVTVLPSDADRAYSVKADDFLEVIVMGDRFICSACNADFKYRTSCVRHFTVHLGKSCCPICNKSLCHQYALKQHLLSHSKPS